MHINERDPSKVAPLLSLWGDLLSKGDSALVLLPKSDIAKESWTSPHCCAKGCRQWVLGGWGAGRPQQAMVELRVAFVKS